MARHACPRIALVEAERLARAARLRALVAGYVLLIVGILLLVDLVFRIDRSPNPHFEHDLAPSTPHYEHDLARAQRFTMVAPSHLRLAYDAITRMNSNSSWIPGDIVECGVWKGGSSLLMALAHQRSASESRRYARDFWLFDTYTGLPPPTKQDGQQTMELYRNVTAGRDRRREEKGLVTRVPQEQANGGPVARWNYGPLEVVRGSMKKTIHPLGRSVHFVQGKVEDTLRARNVALPTKIALLRLDTDWYGSTSAELEVLFDRIVPGGLLVIDDYCTWGGARGAVNDFFARRKWSALLSKAKRNTPCLHLRVPTSGSAT